MDEDLFDASRAQERRDAIEDEDLRKAANDEALLEAAEMFINRFREDMTTENLGWILDVFAVLVEKQIYPPTEMLDIVAFAVRALRGMPRDAQRRFAGDIHRGVRVPDRMKIGMWLWQARQQEPTKDAAIERVVKRMYEELPDIDPADPGEYVRNQYRWLVAKGLIEGF